MEQMLMDIVNDGEKLVLMDGSEWMINPGDMPTVCTWIPTATIKIEETDNNDTFSYKLTNLNIDVTVYAMKIS